MHFIERLFGLAPDGGNGSLELLTLLLLLITMAFLVVRRRDIAGRARDFVSPLQGKRAGIQESAPLS